MGASKRCYTDAHPIAISRNIYLRNQDSAGSDGMRQIRQVKYPNSDVRLGNGDYSRPYRKLKLSHGRALRVTVLLLMACDAVGLNLLSQGKPTHVSHGATGHCNHNCGYKVVDGNTATNWGSGTCMHSDHANDNYWRVDLGHQYEIDNVQVWGRTDCCHANDRNAYVRVGDYGNCYSNAICGGITTGDASNPTALCTRKYGHETGRYVTINCSLSFE